MDFEKHADKYLNFDGSLGANANKMIGANDYYVGGNGMSSYDGDAHGLGTIDEADRTLTVTVVNDGTSGNPSEVARLFGTYTNPTDAQPTGVTITVAESSMAQVRAELSANPMLILGFKYVVTNVAQFSNNIEIFAQQSTGMTVSKSLQPLSWRSAQNFISTQIDAPALAFPIDGKTELRIPVNANETITLILSLKTRGDITNILRGKPVVDIATAKAPTGLPQLDLPRGARG